MTPREVLEPLAINLHEWYLVKGHEWNFGQFPIYKKDLLGDETIADAVELVRQVFGDLDIPVVVTSEGVLQEEDFYLIRIQFV